MKILGRLCDAACTAAECVCIVPMILVDVQEAPPRSRAREYNGEYTREVVDNVESPTAGLSHFPEQAGRLRDHEGEAS